MKMRVKKFAGILFVTGLVAVSVCGCNGKIFKEIAGVETTNVENDADVNANDDTIEKQQSCTIDGVAIYVDKDWTACDGYDGTFEVIKEKEYFQFQAVTELGGYEPERCIFGYWNNIKVNIQSNNVRRLKKRRYQTEQGISGKCPNDRL